MKNIMNFEKAADKLDTVKTFPDDYTLKEIDAAWEEYHSAKEALSPWEALICGFYPELDKVAKETKNQWNKDIVEVAQKLVNIKEHLVPRNSTWCMWCHPSNWTRTDDGTFLLKCYEVLTERDFCTYSYTIDDVWNTVRLSCYNQVRPDRNWDRAVQLPF